MPDFAYIARDLTGNRVEGTLAAGNEREAIAALSGRDLFPLKVASADGRAAGAKRSPKVSARVMASTYAQLSALLGSGVPLLRSLEVLREQTPHKNLAVVLEDVHSRVQEGTTLADTMARHPRAFGELATSIVRAGGEGGFLEEALDRLAKFIEQQDELKGKVVGALAYPTILFVLGHGRRQRADHLLRSEVRADLRRPTQTRRTTRRHRLAAVAQPHDAKLRHLHLVGVVALGWFLATD